MLIRTAEVIIGDTTLVSCVHVGVKSVILDALENSLQRHKT